MATDKINSNFNDFSESFNPIRKIKNGEFVDEVVANRPSGDVSSNTEILSGAIDVLNSESVGEWGKNKRYYLGDVVSFAGEYFKSISDDNLGNIPIVMSSREIITDSFWSPLTSAEMLIVRDSLKRDTNILIEQDDTAIGAVASLNATSGISKLSNGRFATKFSMSAGVSYTFIRGSMGCPFISSYKLYFKFTSGSGTTDWPEESYVEMDIVYLGFDYNSNGLIVPEVHFKNCSTKVGSYDYINKSSPSYWDRYGAYGISIQSNLCLDGSVSITIVSKWNCEIRVAGDYNVQPIMDQVTSVASVKYAYSVNHLVRPYGGDSAQNIGALVPFDASLTRRQVWDRGLLWRFQNIAVTSDVYTLFMISRGYKINYKGSRSGTIPSDLTSVTPKNNERSGVASLTLKAVSDRVLRGVGTLSSTIGEYQSDAIRNISGNISIPTTSNTLLLVGSPFDNQNDGNYSTIYNTEGAVERIATGENATFVWFRDSTHYFTYTREKAKLGINASNQVPTSNENRVSSIGVEYFSQTH